MSIRFTVDHTAKLVVAKAEGPVTYDDIRTHLLEERNYNGLSYAEIIDSRTMIPELTSAEVRGIVQLLQSFGREDKLGPTAVVVGSEFAFGMTRMLGILAEDICVIQPFWSFEEADAWLHQLSVRSD